ncbi:hypothetical protein ACTFIV_007154 [Dictyostelium citrinum]
MIKKLFLLLILTFILIQSFTIIRVEGNPAIHVSDVSNEVYPYNKYPQDTNGSYCSFFFLVFVVDISDTGVQLKTYTNDSSVSISTPAFKNSSSQLIPIYATKSPNSYSLLFTAEYTNDSSISTSIIINYYCEYIPRESMKINLYYTSKYKHPIYPFSTIMHITGLKYPLGRLQVDKPSNVKVDNVGPFLYHIGDDFNGVIEPNFNISLWFLDSANKKYSLNFTIPSLIYSNSNIHEKDITFNIYPNQTSVTEFGYNCLPIYSITLNETLGLSDPFFINKNTASSPWASYEIPGKGTTFLGQVLSSYSIDAQINGTLTTIYSEQNLNVSNIFDRNFPPIQIDYLSQSLPSLSSVFSIKFNSTQKFDLFDYPIGWVEGFTNTYRWPLGFESGHNSNFSFKSSHLQSTNSVNTFNSLSFNQNPYITKINNPQVVDINTLPILELDSFNSTHLYDQVYLFRIKIKSTYISKGYSTYIKFNDNVNTILRYESMPDVENNVYETIVNFHVRVFESLRIGDSYSRQSQFYFPSLYYSIDPLLKLDFQYLDLVTVLVGNVTYLLNNIDVTNKSVDNIMYFNYNGTGSPQDNTINFSLFLFSQEFKLTGLVDLTKIRTSTWNSTISKYQIEFTIPANTRPGPLGFALICGYSSAFLSDFLPYSSQLIIGSQHFDEYGPIFSNIEKENSLANQFGWKFTIDDPINGFDYGDIIVRGEMDSSIYRFHLTTQNLTRGDRFNGDYQINITLPSKCASQNYIITEVKLYDTQGYQGEFSISSGFNSVKNPFINYLSDPTINKLYKTCSGSTTDGIDSSPPVLNSFTSSLVQNSDGTQFISFNFEAVDLQSGLKDKQYPIVYIQTTDFRTLECISSITSINETTATYSCTIELPVGFGYNSDIIFSVYGFINNGGYYSGYSSESLKNLSFIYSMSNIALTQAIKINGCSKFESGDSELWITGRGFNSTKQQVYVKYYGDLYFNQIIVPKKVYFSAMFIKNIKPTDKPFIIKVQDLPLVSNEFTVIPIVYNFTIPLAPTETPTSTPTSTPTETPTPTTPTSTPIPTSSPIPTNKPQICLGDPVCGGTNQGYCSPTGCVCYQPWIGNDCNSQVIIIPQPSTNTSQPSTELPIIDNNNNQTSNSTNHLFKSLISIVSLRELDFNSNEINLYRFDKWIYTPINHVKSQYFASIQSDPKSINPLTTNITVTLEWFNQTTIIQFANNNITMNPSSVKYTMEITEYKFINQLNSLQLIMSALFESSNEDTCSLKEFGDTSNGDNSNFFKIQIDNHSLYGRFIKRAIIDSKVSSIENQLLDSEMKSIQTSSTSQSFIGITIPNYKQSIIIDPDFSVLIDSKSISNEDNNSVCTSNKSKLTSAQLAGIIIGSVAFASVVIISVVYLVVKNRKSDLFQKNVEKKLQKMN